MISISYKYSDKDLTYTYEGVRDPELDELLKELSESIELKKVD
jgi:hypothetical protein